MTAEERDDVALALRLAKMMGEIHYHVDGYPAADVVAGLVIRLRDAEETVEDLATIIARTRSGPIQVVPFVDVVRATSGWQKMDDPYARAGQERRSDGPSLDEAQNAHRSDPPPPGVPEPPQEPAAPVGRGWGRAAWGRRR